MTGRRTFLLTLLAAPVLGRAQSESARVGLLRFGNRASAAAWVEAFSTGMRDFGYREGKNLALELRFADGEADRLPALAAELVRLKVQVIVATDTPATRAAQLATGTIPIVMANVLNPVGSGFVSSLSRPGGNITGVSNMTSDLSPKHLELLLALLPKLSGVAVLSNPANPGHQAVLKSIAVAGESAGIRVVPVEARSAEQLESAFTSISRSRAGAVIIAVDAFFTQQIEQIVRLAIRSRLPTIASLPDYAQHGCLLGYGQDTEANYRLAATYVHKILGGAKPSDLPVEQPTKIQLVVNLRTAKSVGVTVPRELLVRADRIIE
ncbi:MAG: hypothetical protein QOD26_3382 [Betaproteobacteria bacterium]|jgi:putative ABC transport system substrate-binding protein|nr:hypothetical protein [Betaproteobacteria bacterium]